VRRVMVTHLESTLGQRLAKALYHDPDHLPRFTLNESAKMRNDDVAGRAIGGAIECNIDQGEIPMIHEMIGKQCLAQLGRARIHIVAGNDHQYVSLVHRLENVLFVGDGFPTFVRRNLRQPIVELFRQVCQVIQRLCKHASS